MISNSGTTSNTSFFTPLPRSLLLLHFQSWTSSAANHLSKQFSKLSTPLSGNGTPKQLNNTSFLIDWYLQHLHGRTDETLPWYLGNCSTGRIAIKNHVNLVVCYQQTVATHFWQHVLLALNVSHFLLHCALTLTVPILALANFFLPS